MYTDTHTHVCVMCFRRLVDGMYMSKPVYKLLNFIENKPLTYICICIFMNICVYIYIHFLYHYTFMHLSSFVVFNRHINHWSWKTVTNCLGNMGI